MTISAAAYQGWIALVALMAVIAFLWAKVWPVVSRFVHFLDDFIGEKARPGVPARPGVMERLQALEEALDEIRYHVQPNGGRSAHDRLVARVDALVARLDEHMAASTASHRAIWERLDALARRREETNA